MFNGTHMAIDLEREIFVLEQFLCFVSGPGAAFAVVGIDMVNSKYGCLGKALVSRRQVFPAKLQTDPKAKTLWIEDWSIRIELLRVNQGLDKRVFE